MADPRPRPLFLLALLVLSACAPGLDAPERFGYLADPGRDGGVGSDGGTDAGVDTGVHFNCDPRGPDAGCQVLRTFYCTCATTGCHSRDDAAQSLDLQSPGMPDRLVNQQAHVRGSWVMIDPIKPDSSYLYVKVLAKPPFGTRMPNGEAALPDAEIACIKRWIYDAVGAP